MIDLYVNGVAIIAPGLDNWEVAQRVFRGKQLYEKDTNIPLKADMLPANERRRTTNLIKLALMVANDVIDKCHLSNVASIFSSSDGDLFIVDNICRSLLEIQQTVSPTMFHNSVHNAPAGYYAIAAESTAPYSSISAGSASFCYGLLECAAQTITEERDVLYVAYDYPGPELIKKNSDVKEMFAVSMHISSQKMGADSIRLRLQCADMCEGESISCCDNDELESLRLENPIARCLPLLQAIANQNDCTVYLPCADHEVMKIQVFSK